ncbi:MAG: amidohydrolase [Candidatus Omnitrophica bacterium]|nr:amidohydrolase [Candidatus Omnitrophota bacterium]
MKFPEIIDCHIHPAIDRKTDLCWYHRSRSMRKQFDDLKRSGITKACGSIIVSGKPAFFDVIRKINDAALSIRDRYPDFYIPGIQIHPDFPDQSCKEIERCCGRHDVRWVGELVGYLMGFGNDYTSDNMMQIMRTIARFNAVVNLHCSDIYVVEKLCKKMPEIKFVLAHPWERDVFESRIKAVARLKNLYLDCSGTGIDRYGMLRKAASIAGKKKLLFGSDYPINNPAVYIHGALFENLQGNFYKDFFAENFKKILGLRGG